MKILYEVAGKQFEDRKKAEAYENSILKSEQQVAAIKKMVSDLNDAIRRNPSLVRIGFNQLTSEVLVHEIERTHTTNVNNAPPTRCTSQTGDRKKPVDDSEQTLLDLLSDVFGL